MIYKKTVKRCWKSLNKEQKQQVKTMLRDFHDRIIYETSEAVRLEKLNLKHSHQEAWFRPIEGTKTQFWIDIKVIKNF